MSKKHTKVGKRTEYTTITDGRGRKIKVPRHMAARLRRRLGLARKHQARSLTMPAWAMILPN